MVSIARSLLRIKQELHEFVADEMVLSACRDCGHRWRERQLGPVKTVHLFVLQLLHFNLAMTGLRHASKLPVKASAYCKARLRLPLAVLEKLLVGSSQAMRKRCESPQSGWCGLRAFLVDGSSTIAPDTPSSQKAFGQPKGCKSGCGFPVPKTLALFDAFSGLIVQVIGFALYTHEQSKVWMLHPFLSSGDLLAGDRGFCSFVHLAMLSMRKLQALFRMHQKTIVSFRPHRKHRRKHGKGEKAGQKRVPSSEFVRRLGKHDQIVRWFRPALAPKWMNPRQFMALPESLLLREIRYVLPRNGQRTLCVTLITTLLDPILYPKEKICDLYGVRWRVETHFAQLKTTMKMRKLKSQTAEGVKKELTVYALVYNLVHLLMLKSAHEQKVQPHRISFIDTLRWLIHAEPGEAMPALIVNPHRPNRHEPRVVKDIADTYTKMSHPRSELKKDLKQQGGKA